MRRAGIIGGIAPPSTVDYYNRIIAACRAASGSYPPLVINSIDVTTVLRLAGERRLSELADYVSVEIDRLVAAGVDFIAISSNTPHIVFDDLRARAKLPIVSIVEATRDAVRELGAKTALLFGTRSTMEGGFYQRVLREAGVEVSVPGDQERSYIHEKYVGELVNNVFAAETRERMLAISHSHPADVLILGGTELPLLLRDADAGMPMIDTTQVHVEKIVEEILKAS
jgi:aspartate racemase